MGWVVSLSLALVVLGLSWVVCMSEAGSGSAAAATHGWGETGRCPSAAGAAVWCLLPARSQQAHLAFGPQPTPAARGSINGWMLGWRSSSGSITHHPQHSRMTDPPPPPPPTHQPRPTNRKTISQEQQL